MNIFAKIISYLFGLIMFLYVTTTILSFFGTIYSKNVIKQYEPKIPLTYHYINTDTDETDLEKLK